MRSDFGRGNKSLCLDCFFPNHLRYVLVGLDIIAGTGTLLLEIENNIQLIMREKRGHLFTQFSEIHIVGLLI